MLLLRITLATLIASGLSVSPAVPVEETELMVEVPEGIRLAGTLFAPEGRERLPTLVFGHGSGKELRVPLLAILGGRDGHVPTDLAEASLRRALEEGGNPSFKILVLPEEDHAMWEWTEDSVPVMKRSMYRPMVDWLRKTLP